MASNLPSYKHIRIKIKGQVQQIILSRSKVLNALNEKLLEELFCQIEVLEKKKEVSFVILRGEGEKAFSAGADLKERSAFDEKHVKSFLDKLNNIAIKIEDSRLIYFAAIDGYAVGGGLEIALACDFRIATKKSVLGLPEVRIGVIPGGGGIARLVNICGFANAKKIAFLGERIDAKSAKVLNLVHEVVQDKKMLDKKVDEYISLLDQGAPLALSSLKKCISYNFKKIRNQTLKFERDMYTKLLDTYDRKEGLKAFSNKRKPKFKGR